MKYSTLAHDWCCFFPIDSIFPCVAFFPLRLFTFSLRFFTFISPILMFFLFSLWMCFPFLLLWSLFALSVSYSKLMRRKCDCWIFCNMPLNLCMCVFAYASVVAAAAATITTIVDWERQNLSYTHIQNELNAKRVSDICTLFPHTLILTLYSSGCLIFS